MSAARQAIRVGFFKAWRAVFRFSVFIAAIAAVALPTAYFPKAYAQATASPGLERAGPVAVEKDANKAKVPMEKVRTVSFFLDDERNVQGKVVSEDKSQITVAAFAGSTIAVSTYDRNKIAARSIRYKTMPESKYWETAAEYFAARTWDFENDPDDFIQAIRCYEKAKFLASGAFGAEHDTVKQLKKKIEQVKADKERWTAEAESRARLKRLELESAFDARMSKTERLVSQNSEQLRRIRVTLEEFQLDTSITELRADIDAWLLRVQSDINTNRRDIDNLRYLLGRFGPIGPGSIIQRRSPSRER